MTVRKARTFVRDVPLNLANLVFVLSLMGYPLVAGASVYFEFPNRLASVPFRGVILILSFCIIALVVGRRIITPFVERKKEVKSDLFWLCWWSFWFLYLVRVFIDFGFNQEVLQMPAWEFALYAFGVSLIPASALGFRDIKIVGEKTLSTVVFLGTIGLMLTLSIIFFQKGFLGLSDFASNRVETDTLNSISLGHLAATVIILSLWGLLSRRQIGVGSITFFGVSLAISVVGLIASASRGPAFALALVLPILFFTPGIKRSWVTVVIVVGFAMWAIFEPELFQSNNMMIVERMRSFEDHERSRLMSEAFDVFIKNPLFGGGVAPLSTYPHNLILESFMVFGVLSGVCFSYLLFYSIFVSFKLLGSSPSNGWVSFLLIQNAVGAMLSASLYSSSILWVLIVVVVSEKGRRHRSEESPRRVVQQKISQSPLQQWDNLAHVKK